tara:strand:+ start:2614 stop:3084 length:471 start_codon:yes stop_codon:yes gene_type:complete
MSGFDLKAIAAASLNRVIGKDGDLPWRLPEDLKWFKKITSGHAILMGRKTWDSIGKSLPNRRNLVLSRSLQPLEGMEVIRSLNELDDLEIEGDLFVIGGGELYKQLLPQCSELYLTTVMRELPDGDVFFPKHESLFEPVETLVETKDFTLRKWKLK